MPQQTDSAVPTRLASVAASSAGRKLRLAGRMLSYDTSTSLMLLLDHDLAVLVDVSLCVNPWSSRWARERLGVVMVIGYLEVCQTEQPIPIIPTYASAPVVDPAIVLRAILVTETTELDMDLWNAAIEAREGAEAAGLGQA